MRLVPVSRRTLAVAVLFLTVTLALAVSSAVARGTSSSSSSSSSSYLPEGDGGLAASSVAGGVTSRNLGALFESAAADGAGDLVDQSEPILGAALTVLADGTEPWEDRPFAVSGLGSLPGNPGVSDPGDDLGPDDGIVRTFDAVIYRASFSVRSGAAEDVVAEVTLSDLARWDESGLDALKLAGCPGGASVLDGGRRLRCVVGRVETPPAVTVALDLSARVSGAALQGDELWAEMTVRASNAVPDPDARNCPVPRPNGCDASSPRVSVSAAPAAELRKYLVGVADASLAGSPGRRLTWYLEVVLGADGDARGSSHPVGAPWTLNDWWRALGPRGGLVPLPVRLERCVGQTSGATWSCAQPGGPGTPIEVTLTRLDEVAWLPSGVSSVLPQAVGRVRIDLWVPEDDLYAAGGDVTFQNCFATEFGLPSRTIWRPVDARGQVNLGGLAEPAANNCSHVVMVGPTPTPTRTRVPPTPRPPRPGPPGPGNPTPRATPTPRLEFSKAYKPFTKGEAVTEGTEFSSEARARVIAGSPANYVIACDKWDNRTQSLRAGSGEGAEIWWQTPGESPAPAADRAHVVLEYGAGSWGRLRTTVNQGRVWYEQAASRCENEDVVQGHGWFLAGEIDFSNSGLGKVNAEDINMVRARFLDEVPVGTSVWLDVPLVAGANPAGTWLMNYGAFAWRLGAAYGWQVGVCYGARGSGSRRECPIPAAGTKDIPGLHGDMLVQVGVPLWLTKQTDPVVPGGSPVVNAGQTVAFTLEAATLPRPGDPLPPDFPPGSFAHGVVVTDTLPMGLTYELGSATIASEDLNDNGVLDPGEDKNNNGRIDYDVPFAPSVVPGPGDGETTLHWYLGNIPYETRVPAIRFEARTSRLVRGGTALVNQAGLFSSLDGPPDCRPGHRDLEGGRCAWAQVIVANIAAAQVEKFARAQLVVTGDPLVFRLALANLTTRPVEWFDGVDILPRAGEPRDPATQLTGGITGVQVTVLPGGSPMEVWASAVDPDTLDTLGGTPRDGLVDPVAAWGGPGAGLGGTDWPCLLADVGTARCPAIASGALVTALRLWGPDPHPERSGGASDSFLPADSPGRWLEVTLLAPAAVPGDLAHNAWGGRFESLPLPVFANAVILIRPPDTPTPTTTPTGTATSPATQTRVPSATFTPGPPTATPSPTNSATATRTPTITPTATPTPIFTIYLPITVRTKCPVRPVDVALVIDASTSMLRPAGDGGTKQDAVHRAARAFLDRFDPSPNGGRVAIVAFNERAWIVQPLTDDRSRLDAALRAIPTKIAEGTRLDLGLLVGADALQPVQGDRWRAMVFLTDGMPNRIPTPQAGGSQEDVVRAAAAAVHKEGIAVFTVGYGREDAPDLADRILPWLLKEIAGTDGEYYETDDASLLADRFRRIAAALGCPGEVRWP